MPHHRRASSSLTWRASTSGYALDGVHGLGNTHRIRVGPRAFDPRHGPSSLGSAGRRGDLASARQGGRSRHDEPYEGGQRNEDDPENGVAEQAAGSAACGGGADGAEVEYVLLGRLELGCVPTRC